MAIQSNQRVKADIAKEKRKLNAIQRKMESTPNIQHISIQIHQMIQTSKVAIFIRKQKKSTTTQLSQQILLKITTRITSTSRTN